MLSPDGKWLAYTATERERLEVFLRLHHKLTPRIEVSSDSGGEPLWSEDGATIYYRHGLAVLAASFDAASARLGTTQEVFGADSAYDWEPGGEPPERCNEGAVGTGSRAE